MKQTRSHPRRMLCTLLLVAACGVAALALAGAALGSTDLNYGNFNPLTGKPNQPAAATLRYGDFNPLSGRPNGAPRVTTIGSADVRAGTTPTPPTRVVETVVRESGGQTLALSLAGAALLVAILGTGYTVIRVSRTPRTAPTR